jgi:hypothetical protein
MGTLAYFSHSYRAEDRDVNSFFWELFHEHKFFFTVDPGSSVFSIPYLESMMLRSNCFVAVIPRRQNVPNLCSPYILFEYGLAVQARKPSLVFVEQDVDSSVFAASPRIVPFNRKRLLKDTFVDHVKALADEVQASANLDERLRGPCGLLIGSGPKARKVYTAALVAKIRQEVEKYGRRCEVVPLDFDGSFELSLKLDTRDLLIAEVGEGLHVPWLPGYLLGRALPCIKVCHAPNPGSREKSRVAEIVARHKPEHTGERAFEYWADEAELLKSIALHVSKFNTARIELHDKQDGLDYFAKAGRRKAKVFVSNASASSDVANRLVARLKRESIDFFHYQVKDAIPVGEDWLRNLEREIEESSIFVALVERDYALSQWCRHELEVARKQAGEGRLKIHPYALNEDAEPLLAALGIGRLQTTKLDGGQEDAAVGTIVDALDRELKSTPAPGGGGGEKRSEPSPQPPVAAPTFRLGEEDRAALVKVVQDRLWGEDAPARDAWVKLLLTRTNLYAILGGEDFWGSASAVALALVTKAESRGTLPDGRKVVAVLVGELAREGYVSAEAAPFLQDLGKRCAA